TGISASAHSIRLRPFWARLRSFTCDFTGVPSVRGIWKFLLASSTIFFFSYLLVLQRTSYYVLLIAYCLSRILRSMQYVVDSCVIRMAACCSLNTSTASRSTLFTDADCELRMPLSRQPRFSVPFVRRLVIYSYVVAMKDSFSVRGVKPKRDQVD